VTGVQTCALPIYMTTTAAWVVMSAALGMCLVIMIKLWNGFQKEKAEKAALALKEGV